MKQTKNQTFFLKKRQLLLGGKYFQMPLFSQQLFKIVFLSTLRVRVSPFSDPHFLPKSRFSPSQCVHLPNAINIDQDFENVVHGFFKVSSLIALSRSLHLSSISI